MNEAADTVRSVSGPIPGYALVEPRPTRYARVRRLLDRAVAATGLMVTGPLLASLDAYSRRRGAGMVGIQRLGQYHTRFRELRLAFPEDRLGRRLTQLRLDRLPLLYNLWRGEVTLLGPRPYRTQEVRSAGQDLYRRHDLPPGLLSLWWVKQRANVAFDDELRVDLEYVDHVGPLRDGTLLVNALLGLLYARPGGAADPRVHLLGVVIDNMRLKDALDRILGWVDEATDPRQVAFVNAHCINVAQEDSDYRAVLGAMDLVLPDGIGVRIAAQAQGRPIAENVNGTDMLPRLCERLSGRRLFLLGGAPGVAEDVARWVHEHHPDVELVGTRDGFFSPVAEESVVQEIAAHRPDVLLVAMGVPRQELFMARHRQRLGAKVVIAVGGLFDFYAGRIPRAPVWMREAGFEWLFRLIQEPERMWRRYVVGNSVFLWRSILNPADESAADQSEERK